jgi:hypothetical protein
MCDILPEPSKKGKLVYSYFMRKLTGIIKTTGKGLGFVPDPKDPENKKTIER